MRRGELAKIWRHSRIYGLSNVLNRLAGLVLLPVYLHVLAPAEFGVLALVTLTTDVLGVVLGMGLGRALLRYHVAAEDESSRDTLVVSALALLIVMGAVFAALALPVARLSCWLIFGDPEHVDVFTYANLAVVFTVLFNFQLSCLVARKASVTYLWASLAKSITLLIANLLLVVHLQMGVTGVVIGTLLSSVVVSGSLLVVLLHGRSGRFSVPAARDLVRLAAPLVPSVLLDTLVASLDKLTLGRLGTAADVGSYASGQRLSVLLQMFLVQPFMQIWAVRQLEALQRQSEEQRRTLSRILLLFLSVLCTGGLFLALFATEILALIASDAYREAASVVPVLALAEALLLFRSFFELGVLHAEATRHLPAVSLGALAAAIPAYAVLAGTWGVAGAALAYLLVAIVRVVLVARLARRVSAAGARLPLRECTLVIVLAVVWFLATKGLVPSATAPGVIAAKGLSVAAFLLAVLAMPAVGGDGRRILLERLRRGRSRSALRCGPGPRP